MKRPKQNYPKVFMEISTRKGPVGRIVMELFQDKVPRTVKNFMELIKTSYKNCKFHRIIPGFVIQGGDFTRGDGSGGHSIYGKVFEDENFILKHTEPGLLSMANAGPGTNGSQFFITLNDLPHLDNKHVVFGRVVQGMDVIRKVETLGSQGGTVKETVKITDCGIL